MSDKATVGTVNVDGTVYEIDWPFRMDDPTERDDFAAVYLDDDQVGEFTSPGFGGFADAEQVLDLAEQFISMGGIG